MRIKLQLELKLLADVGLVGLPNAGKSTFLRALTASRTRVGNWAFTTLSPTIGTLVLDNYTGRPRIDTKGTRHESRTRLTIADIPGLIEDAHLDRGLGLGFLRHIERAAVLAFVIDLNAGDPVAALKALWREVGEYEDLRHREMNADSSSEHGLTSFKPFETSDAAGTIVLDGTTDMQLPPLFLPPISTKPWLVVATKADLPGTQERYQALQEYLRQVQAGEEEHPSGKPKAWRSHLYSLPISAIKKAGVSSFPEIILRLLDS
jgi:GTP-binding protein